MNASVEKSEYRFDGLKWLLVLLLAAAAIVGNSYYSELAVLYRALAVVAIAVAALFVASQTEKGSSLFTLLREAYAEARRVVWPNRQETTQTTLIILAVTVLMALILWLLDTFFGWVASLIIG
jgi:preprotein translocase subunit SecE